MRKQADRRRLGPATSVPAQRTLFDRIGGVYSLIFARARFFLSEDPSASVYYERTP